MGIFFKKDKARWVPLREWKRPSCDTLVLIADSIPKKATSDPDTFPSCTKAWYIASHDRFEFGLGCEKAILQADTAMIMEVPKVRKNLEWYRLR